ncbi:MAG: hypothetical protein ACFFAS_01030 [Promethearchaeota archaeon]
MRKEIDLKTQKLNNTTQIQEIFLDYLNDHEYKGIFGIANFSAVYNELMPVQKDKLNNVLGQSLDLYKNSGSIISLGIFYPPKIIDCINIKKNGKKDNESWNLYAEEYAHLNEMLGEIGTKLANRFDGFNLPPTTGVPAEEVDYVADYFPHTISHRVVAEHAGIGWRGKNELLITTLFGPAVRFTSILCNLPLIQGKKIENQCGDCMACINACPILEKKDRLEDYREKCRKFIISLGLNQDVCGKCIKACFLEGTYKTKPKIQ